MTFIVACVVFSLRQGDAQVTLPPINLGGTSLTDGLSGPGTLLEPIQISVYTAGHFQDRDGKRIPGRNSIEAQSNLFHVAHFTKAKLFGGFYGFEALLPVTNVNVRTDFGPRGKASGAGDLIVSPFMLTWPQRKLLGRRFFSRFTLLAVLPTGRYDDQSSVNVGSNVYSIVPYYAFTLFLTPKWETSGRLHAIWSSKNTDPFARLHASSTQSGQAFFFNYAASYDLGAVRAGLAGYCLRQLTNHRLNEHSLSGSRERVFAAGPVLQIKGKGWNVYVNGYFETAARNRAEGRRFVMRYQKIF